MLFYVGNCLKELDRFEEAIDVLKRAVEADPQDLPNHNLLGFCYYKTKQHGQAVRCFQRAVEIDPGSAIDWANLGSNLRDLGRTDEAMAMYEKALALDPTIGFARTSLTRLRNSPEATTTSAARPQRDETPPSLAFPGALIIRIGTGLSEGDNTTTAC